MIDGEFYYTAYDAAEAECKVLRAERDQLREALDITQRKYSDLAAITPVPPFLPDITPLITERDRLRDALINARTMLVTLGGDPRKIIADHGSASGDEIQAAILDLIDVALAKEENDGKNLA